MLALIPIFLLIAVGLACLKWLLRGRTVSIEPHCATCGYIVHGLPAPVCPECGSDLARPGAIVTTGRRPPGKIARTIIWSVFCLLAVVLPVSIIWRAFIVPVMPQVRDSSEYVTLLQPASKSYRSIDVRAHTHRVAFPHDPDSLPGEFKVELTRSDGTLRGMDIDSTTFHFRDTSAPQSAMSSTPLDAEALVSWLRSIGVQGGTDQLIREMTIVMTHVQRLVSRPPNHQISGNSEFLGFAAGSSSGSANPLPWVGWVPFSVGAIVWVIGMIRIVRKPSMTGDSHMISG